MLTTGKVSALAEDYKRVTAQTGFQVLPVFSHITFQNPASSVARFTA
jgi:hypothetical protein